MSSPASVYSAFAAAAREYPQNPFMHVPASACASYSAGPLEITYAQMMQRVSRLAEGYQAAGYGRDHRVALVLENRPEFVEHFLALNSVGASIVPLSVELRPEELNYLLAHSDTGLIVVLPEHRARIERVVSSLERKPGIVSDTEEKLSPPRIEWTADAALRLGPDAALLYTSGTTGRPKGCVLSNEYFIGCGEFYIKQGGRCTFERGTERLITPLPLNHSNALAWSLMAMITIGGCVIQLDRFHPDSWWNSVRVSRATLLHYLGVMPAMLLKKPPSPDDDFSRQIRFGYGAGVDPRHHAAFEKRFGFPLIEAWAMTESGPGALISASTDPRHVGTRCFGRPERHIEYRLVDESGADVPVGSPGELWVRHRDENPKRYFFSGYYKDGVATQEAWAGGWFHTGDVVRADDEGFLYFVDRRKNIIRRSGENIAAVEVEGALLRHPAVKTCAVAPVADDVRGEEVFACVVLLDPAAGSVDMASEIFAFCKPLLAYFKLPGYLAFVESLPVTGSQKIQRGELKALVAKLMADGRATNLTSYKKRIPVESH